VTETPVTPETPDATHPAQADRWGRSGPLVAFVLVALGGGLTAFAGSRPALTGVDTTVISAPTVGASGVTALGLLGLAGAVALLAVSGWLRVAVGVVIVVAAAVTVALQAAAGGDGFGWTAYGDGTPEPASGLWQVLIYLGAAVLAAGGLLAVLRGRRWPGMSRRYDRAADAPTAGGESTGSTGASRRTDPKSIWDDLDRGEDPTA
jgi:hypothetical protein